MKKNLGSADRIIRLIGGVVCIALFVTKLVVGGLGIALVIVGGILLITSFKSFCPIYLPFGFNTRSGKSSQEKN